MLAVTIALALVAVPTVFAIFPSLATTRLDRTHREITFGAWVAGAAIAALATRRHDDQADRQASETHALALLISRVLIVGPYTTQTIADGDIPSIYRLTAFVWNPQMRKLAPYYPELVRDADDPRCFEIGQGATGESYRRGAVVALVGDAVSNDEYGLSPRQQALFHDAQVVVAAPIRHLDGSVAGVLTVIADVNDHFFVTATDQVVRAHIDSLQRMADKFGFALGGAVQ